jgi:hypothetical protein
VPTTTALDSPPTRAVARRHLIGLLLSIEESWPTAFEAVLRRLGPVHYRGESHEFPTERVVNEPFDLRAEPRYALVIDRLSWWYAVPREWLKKVALMNEVYLLNNPFTFQAMEKHSAYCAMVRLGLKVPETWLIPHKLPPDNPRFAPMAERYYSDFDLDAIGERIGYPLFMKPFDGGAWVGVTRIENADELHRCYDASGERLMHLQAAVEDYDVFTRSLSIGPQTLVVDYEPSREWYERYGLLPPSLSPELETELVTISRLVNAFFRWELNSCEVIVKDGEAHPIDYANASPDLSLVSLHYWFPWAIRALVAWCVFCCVTDRRMRLNQATRDFFEIAARDDLDYSAKLEGYRKLSDSYHQVDDFAEFSAAALANLDEAVVDFVESPEFDELLVHVITSGESPELHELLIERGRERARAWVGDQNFAPSGG